MPDILIRDVPEELHRALKARAAKSGHSMSAEARRILEAAVDHERGEVIGKRLQAFVRELYGGEPPKGAVDELIAERRREAKREEEEFG